MTAIIFGLLTAALFATSTLSTSRAIRIIPAQSIVGSSMLIGLVLTIPFAIADGIPDGLRGGTIVWFLVSGLGNVGGLLLVNAALKVGKVGIVAPIVATEGAISAVFAAALGESVMPIAAFVLLLIVAGVVLSAVAPDPEPLEHERPLRAVLLATAAAAAFGVSLFATGYLSDDLPTSWLLLPARIIGVLVLAIPLLVLGRLRMTRRALPFVIVIGFAEVIGFSAFTIGARDSVAIASVLASQFASIGAVGAYLLFKERLGRLQVLGVVMLVVGVATLTILRSG
ncbi:MAG: DMT family transporter [Actinomycetales bacterium]|nr:DMT family transporter [Actinomycetales bacterium]